MGFYSGGGMLGKHLTAPKNTLRQRGDLFCPGAQPEIRGRQLVHQPSQRVVVQERGIPRRSAIRLPPCSIPLPVNPDLRIPRSTMFVPPTLPDPPRPPPDPRLSLVALLVALEGEGFGVDLWGRGAGNIIRGQR